MQRDEIITTLWQYEAQFAGFGVKSLAIFGSVARNELRPDSDIDILVDFEGAATFNQYMDLKFLLEDVFNRSIDLVTRKSLRAQLRQRIEQEAIYVA